MPIVFEDGTLQCNFVNPEKNRNGVPHDPKTLLAQLAKAYGMQYLYSKNVIAQAKSNKRKKEEEE